MIDLSKIILTHDGKNQSALAWRKELDFPKDKLHKRIKRLGPSAPFEDLFFTGTFERRNLVSYKGKTMNTYEWDRHFRYPLETVRRRLKRGWTMEEIERNFRSNTCTYHHLTINGITDTERGWARRRGVDYKLYRYRKNAGWTTEESLGFKKHQHKLFKMFSYRREKHNYADWARKLGISENLFSTRVKAYEKHLITKSEVVNPQDCFNARLGKRRFWKGKKYTVSQSVKIAGFDKCTFYDRLNKGWSIKKIMTTPPTDTGHSGRIRNQRLRELKQMGIIV